MAVIGIAAIFQVIHVDPIWRLVSISVVAVVAVIGSLVFFTFAIRDR